MPLVVLDTNILVAAFRSRDGASFQLLAELRAGAFEIALSVPLVLEYEQALRGNLGRAAVPATDIRDFLDYLCAIGRHQDIHYLWRPTLRDPKDEFVLELAVAADAEAIVTYNVFDFGGATSFRPRIVTGVEFLRELRGLK